MTRSTSAASQGALDREAKQWIQRLGSTPGDVAQAIEFLLMANRHELVEWMLAAVEGPATAASPGLLTRTRETRLPWRFTLAGGRSQRLIGYAPHAAAALCLAARTDGPAAQRLRRSVRLSLEGDPHGWTHDGFESFTELTTLHCGRWHPDAQVPPDIVALPKATHVYFTDVPIGDRAAARCTWNLPNVKVLSLANCDLRHVPEGLRGCRALENLSLAGNALEALPAWLAELPNLRHVSLGDAPSTALSASLQALLRERREGAFQSLLRKPRGTHG
jgi:hypothetical protein